MSLRASFPFTKLLIAMAAALLLAAQCADARLSFQSIETEIGYVAVGSTHFRTLTLQNSGRVEATLTGFSVRRSEPGVNPYSVTGGTCLTTRRVAANGGTCTVVVAYTSTLPQITSATLEVLYNWADSGVEVRAAYWQGFWASATEGVLLSAGTGRFIFEAEYLWQVVGTSSAFVFSLNNYMLSDVILGSVTTEGVGLAPPFSVSGGTCATGTRLATQASCTIQISFTPSEVRRYEASFAIPYTSQNSGASGYSQRIRAAGSGVPPLAISDIPTAPSPGFDFGALSIGSRVKKILTVVNWQGESVSLGTVSSAALGVSAPFAYAGGSCVSGGVLTGGGGSCTLEVVFTPSSLAPVSNRLQLGYRSLASGTESSATELLTAAGAVRDPVKALSDASLWSTCALLESGNLRCWGRNAFGQLGYGNTDDVGDNEFPAARGNVNVGGRVTQVATHLHTCAL
ncbi:MAG TPA: choice-of-anchor D domain-containing protein, partial [Polyangiaceae bacterium]|nr:choice-of-anchor D domain-containing protein [Polyangiaceae bacterium]